MDQREVWNAIAPEWHKYRASKPQKDILEFISQSNGLILDFGCGSGRHMVRGKKYAGFDFAETMIRFAKSKAKKEKIKAYFAIARGDSMPFKSNAFDAVAAANVIHQIEGKSSRKKSIEEIFRVMKPGASAIISVWNKNQPRLSLKKKEDFVTWKIGDKIYRRYYYFFSEEELKKLLKDAGFAALRIFGSSHKAFKLFPMDIVAIVQKP